MRVLVVEDEPFLAEAVQTGLRREAVAADVARGKPHPDVFLKAADKLGVPPADCIVFEDAPMGVEAARRAGMKAVVITTTLPAAAFREFDNIVAIVAHYEELDVGELPGHPVNPN